MGNRRVSEELLVRQVAHLLARHALVGRSGRLVREDDLVREIGELCDSTAGGRAAFAAAVAAEVDVIQRIGHGS